jgi:hypothetical protein
MAGLGNSNHLDNTSAIGGSEGFVPEIWIDQAIVTYEQALQLGDKVSKIDFSGNKGDTIQLPSLTTRGTPSLKAEDTQVSLIQRTAGEVTVSLDKHYEYSFLIEDRTSMQALDSLLREYVNDMGYGLARRKDQDIWMAMKDMQGGANFAAAVIGSDGSTAWSGTANGNTGNAAALTDAGIRKIIQTLDDSDNPMMDRHLVIPPVERNNIMGLARFSEQAFIGNGSTIRNGVIGNLYGVDVSVSTNCPYVHLDSSDGGDVFNFSSTAIGTGSVSSETGETETVTTDGGVAGRVAAMFHKDAIVLAEQMDIRMQKQYKQEYLGDLHTADCLYGVKEKRDYGAVAIVVAD